MIGGARSWQQQTVVLDQALLRLEQLRAPAEELLGEAMAEGFRQGLLVRGAWARVCAGMLFVAIGGTPWKRYSCVDTKPCDSFNRLGSKQSAFQRMDGETSQAVKFCRR